MEQNEGRLSRKNSKLFSPFEDREDTCLNCGRSSKYGVSFMNVVFAVNPNSYHDFYINPSLCSHCMNEICRIFDYDFYNYNPDLINGYNFIKNDGFLDLVNQHDLDKIMILIIGVRPNNSEDYHVLLVDKKFEQAVLNVENCLLRGSYKKQIKSFKDLLDPIIEE